MACDFGSLDDLAGKKLSQSHSQVYYACKHFEAVQNNLVVQGIIAAAQTLAQIYFADKQYRVAKQAQDRLDRIAEEQLSTAQNLRNQYQYGMACERVQVDDACNLAVLLPDYASVRARVAAPIRAQSSRRRQQAYRCATINCLPAYCDNSDKIMQAEQREISRASESAYRREEALYEIRKAQRRDFRMSVLQHMRGLNAAASSAIAGATAAATAAAGINPYAGWASAVNAAAGRASALSSAFSTANAAQGMGAYGQQRNISEQGVYPASYDTTFNGNEMGQVGYTYDANSAASTLVGPPEGLSGANNGTTVGNTGYDGLDGSFSNGSDSTIVFGSGSR